MADETTAGFDGCPSATASRIAFVIFFPTKLGACRSVMRAAANIEEAPERAENNLAVSENVNPLVESVTRKMPPASVAPGLEMHRLGRADAEQDAQHFDAGDALRQCRIEATPPCSTVPRRPHRARLQHARVCWLLWKSRSHRVMFRSAFQKRDRYPSALSNPTTVCLSSKTLVQDHSSEPSVFPPRARSQLES
jgi:hypothetical protein